MQAAGDSASPVDRWREAGGDPGALPAAIGAALPAVFAASDFVLDAAIREPGLLASLAEQGLLARPRARGEIERIARSLADPVAGEADLMRELRQLRRRELALRYRSPRATAGRAPRGAKRRSWSWSGWASWAASS
jgi:glutamine synthetase adenylyltransferase